MRSRTASYLLPSPALLGCPAPILMSALLLMGILFTPALSAEPNDDFGAATVLAAGVLSVTDSLAGEPLPDTYLGAFGDATFTPPAIAENDDFGAGLASQILDVPVNADGSIHLAVTGCCDNFGGTHGEEGEYDLLVEVFDSGGSLLTDFTTNSTLLPTSVDQFSFDDPAWVGGTFNAETDNTVGGLGADPIDYWVFSGLAPGTPFLATTSSAGTDADIDTMLAWFDDAGDLLFLNDDNGVDLFSRLMGTVPANGQVILAVTGYPDFDLIGSHGEIGDYVLTISPGVPEPMTSCLLLMGLAAALGWRRK